MIQFKLCFFITINNTYLFQYFLVVNYQKRLVLHTQMNTQRKIKNSKIHKTHIHQIHLLLKCFPMFCSVSVFVPLQDSVNGHWLSTGTAPEPCFTNLVHYLCLGSLWHNHNFSEWWTHSRVCVPTTSQDVSRYWKAIVWDCWSHSSVHNRERRLYSCHVLKRDHNRQYLPQYNPKAIGINILRVRPMLDHLPTNTINGINITRLLLMVVIILYSSAYAITKTSSTCRQVRALSKYIYQKKIGHNWIIFSEVDSNKGLTKKKNNVIAYAQNI